MENGDTVKAQIWDPFGDERTNEIRKVFYRNAVGALIIYDITNEQSYLNVKDWVEKVKQNAKPGALLTLVGTNLDKCQKDSKQRKVPYSKALQFAKQNEMLFFETSST